MNNKKFSSDDLQNLSPNKRALLKIRELKQQLADAQTVTDEPIAIVSMACRFPRRAKTPEAFWQMLVDQTDEVGDIPDDRWDLDAFHDDDPDVPGKMYARRGVFLDDIDMMDPEFFGISPREATWVDPQQRLLMETGWEALERAGWPTGKIGEHTGVFVGWMHNDYQNEASDSFLNLNPYIATGAAGSFLCGRLAYYLGLQGPSVAVDTACSSSLVALHLAIQSLQRRDCDRALVGGVNAICSPTTNILTCKLQALSPTGQSRAFDAAADGYLRGEGCGVVTLRRLADAQADNDPIIGIVRGSAIGHNGAGGGLTVPNPKAQEKVIRAALKRAKIDPNEVAYLEAHGTGTALGDPIEMRAAAAALAADRTPDNPLLVGSVKTNIGHLEAAAGMAGLIKVLLSMQHDAIPGQLNFEVPNPHIPWDSLPVKVLTDQTAWPNPQRKIAGVSAFGMSGTNAHVVIEAPDQWQVTTRTEPSPQLLVLSGKNETAKQTLADDFSDFLGESEASLDDVAYSAAACRDHFEHRIAVVGDDRPALIQNLKAIARGTEQPNRRDSAFSGQGRRKPKLAWQFTGQGCQYVGMASGLYQQQPLFREAIDFCDARLQAERKESLIEVLFRDPDKINDTTWTQPAIFAVQMGLAKLLQSWGIEPDVVIGHSVGQYAAACVAGIMSWQDGLHLIAHRGRLIGELPAGGKMLAVFAPLVAVEAALQQHPEVSLAALNGTHIVVSGPESAVAKIEASFTDRQVRTKALKTSHAFHSSLMEPALASFELIADQVSYELANLPLVCNVSGEVLPADAKLDGAYWAKHIRSAVRYAEGIDAINEANCEVVLELGPQSVLTRMAAANWQGSADRLVSSLRKDADDATSLLQAVGQLYVQGVNPNFDVMFADGGNAESQPRRVLLPTYPFQRRRFWGPDKPRAAHANFHTAHPLLGGEVALAGVAKNEKRYESFIEPDSPPWLPDHEVMGNVVLPGAAYLEMAIAAAGADAIADVTFEQALQPSSRTTLQTIVKSLAGDAEGRSIETYSAAAGSSQWARNFSGRLVPTSEANPEPVDRAALESKLGQSAQPSDFYRHMLGLGLNYGPKFQTIQSIAFNESEVLSRLENQGDVRGFTIPPTLLDGALHSLAVGLLREDDGNLFLPVGIGHMQCYGPIENDAWCHAVWKQNEGKIRLADLTLFNDAGDVLATIVDLKVQQVSVAALRQISGSGAERLVYDLRWEPMRLPAATAEKVHWLIVRDGDANGTLGDSISQALAVKESRATEVVLSAGAEFKHVDGAFTIDAAQLEHWSQLFDALEDVPAGIAWLTDSVATQAHCEGLLNLFATLQAREVRSLQCGLQLLTANAVSIDDDIACDPAQTKFWGLGRVIGAEHPQYRCRLIDVAVGDADVESIVDILLTETKDNQLAIRDGRFHVPRMKQAATKPKNESAFADGFECRGEVSYLITGGLGMLGRQAAKWLANHGAKQVVLVSRRQPNEAARAFIDLIEADGCEVVVHNADIGSRDEVQKMFVRFGNELLPLAGVIHAAGVLDDGLLEQQTWQRFEEVMSPKIVGASLLHEFTADLPLDFFILYSSAASLLGSRGQSNYATANAFLDGLAWQRRAAGLPATSINWGPWTEGMADDERIQKQLALQGIAPLTIADAHAAMEKILVADIPQALVMDVQWRRMQLGGGASAMLSGLIPPKQKSRMGDSQLVAKLKQLRGGAKRELLVKTVTESLQRILSTPEAPQTDRPLIEMGLDSLMAVEFGTELQQMLGDGFDVGPTMLFDHPSIDAITDHVLELVVADSEGGDTTKADSGQANAEKVQTTVREDVAVIGLSCRFPGARDADEFWQNLLDGVDSVSEIPADRWDIDRFYSADREPGKMYTRSGGFLDDIADFDAAFFNISDQEACWVDPQHRMLLENSYRAMEHAGVAAAPLADANVGVFMGIMGQDYAFLPTLDDQHVVEAFQGAGLSHSAGVGRISYVFGFEGPSVAVDTASSSSLVALMQAVRSLQEGACNMALAGGVNAILAPVNSLLMSKAGLLSEDGRCKSFSAAASGFGRGEGCGVVVLKRLSDAQRDGDRIMAVVRGGAVVHNGFSSGITAPSGKAQSRVITDALRDAKLAPSQVQYLEAHGTGTEYGDPMELTAAAAVYGKGRQKDKPLLVGSVKANISHLEAAGGSSGLIKTVLSLHHGIIPPQIHFDEPSPHIPWQRLPVKMVTETTAWPAGEQRLAAVTALGLVGTNAHVVLGGSPTEPSEEAVATQESLLVLSARSKSALKAMANDYAQWLQRSDQVALEDVCFTAATGRRHFEHRLAVVANSSEDAAQRLRGWSKDAACDRVSTGNPTGSPRLLWCFTGDSNSDFDFSRGLFCRQPAFRDAIAKMDQRLQEHLAQADPSAPPLSGGLAQFFETGDETPAADIHVYAMQAALAQLWLSWGVQPDAAIGLGVGQYAATGVAGGLCFLDAAVLVFERQRVIEAIAESPDEVDAVLDAFEKLADKMNFYPPNLPLVCSLDGNIVPVHRSLGGSYWRRHVTEASKSSAALAAAVEQGSDLWLQLGPFDADANNGGVQALAAAKKIALHRAPKSGENPIAEIWQTVGGLHVAGVAIDFRAIYADQPRQKVALPSYPFQKKRYWITEVEQFVNKDKT